MTKSKQIVYGILTLFLGALVTMSSYAFFTWSGDEYKQVYFNTAKELQNYIVYDEGDSQFSGEFKISDSFEEGIHSTISIMKTLEAENVDLVAAINLDVNQIGSNMRTSTALKWTVTSGDDTDIGSVIASGNFVGVSADDTITLVPSLPVTTSEEKYTIWIWLDASEDPSQALTGEILDVDVWIQIDQIAGRDTLFEVTQINANYQIITTTAVNNTNNIVSWAIMSTTGAPNTTCQQVSVDCWNDIADIEQNKVYNIAYAVNATGTYHAWFKDSEGNTTSRNITVSNTDLTAPVCTFGVFADNYIIDGETTTITLTCIDNESDILRSDLSIEDFAITNDYIEIVSISKERITNGYEYNIGVNAIENTSGLDSITLPQYHILNGTKVGNTSSVSGNIQIKESYEVTFNANEGTVDTSSKIVIVGDTYGELPIPTRLNFHFDGWFTASSDGTEITEETTVNLNNDQTLYAHWTFEDEITAPTISFDGNIVTSGLVAQLDGINNTGNGYDNDATGWTDLSGNDNDVTLVGSAWNDFGITFDGVDDYATFPSILDNEHATLEATFEINSIGNRHNIIGNPQGGGIQIFINTAGLLYGSLYINSGWTSIYYSQPIDIDTIYTAAVTYDGTSLKLYQNGILVASNSLSGTVTPPAEGTLMTLGCDPNATGGCGNYNLGGKIYSARIYNRALTQAEVRQNYNMDRLSIGEYGRGTPNFTISGSSSENDTIVGYKYQINNSGTWSTYNANSKPTFSTQGENDISAYAYNTYNTVGDEGTTTAYLDNTAPTGTISFATSSVITATVSASDALSGLQTRYGYKLSTSNVCNSSTTGFTENNSNTYTFTINTDGTYYLCVRIEDKAGNYGYILEQSPATYYTHTDDYQVYTASQTGYYYVETWGAKGGTANYSTSYTGGKGGSSSGYIYLSQGDKLYIYVGRQGKSVSGTTAATVTGDNTSSYNGGGPATFVASNSVGGGGGGATDIRYFGSTTPTSSDLEWNSTLGLNSRIMVAAGGGGAKSHNSTPNYSGTGGAGGTLVGGKGTSASTTCYAYGSGAMQLTTGSSITCANNGHEYANTALFGYGWYDYTDTDNYKGSGFATSGGGGGYYGGGIGSHAPAGGGSSFMSGYAGSNAITSSSDRTATNGTLHYSNKYFIDGEMTSGTNNGDGQARITYYGSNEPTRTNHDLEGVRYIRDCISGSTISTYTNWVELQAIKNGVNLAKSKTVSYSASVPNTSTHAVTYLVDGDMENTDGTKAAGAVYDSGNQCLTVDLGQAYDLDEVAIWHYYFDGRTYNDNVTYVSSNNSSWIPIIADDSAETANGKRVSAWDPELPNNSPVTMSTVTYYANKFGTENNSISGLSFSYNESTNVLTLNGTGTVKSMKQFSILAGQTFEVGEKYTLKLTWVSGDYTVSNSASISFVVDASVNGAIQSPRTNGTHYIGATPPLSGSTTKTWNINSDLTATSADGFMFWLYQSVASGVTFNNYQVKVEFYKAETRFINVGDTYDLPTSNPSRYLKVFAGWYTASSGGTQVTGDTVMSNSSNHTIYAHWADADTSAPTLSLSVPSGSTYAKSKTATITIADNIGLAAGTYTIKYAWGTSAVACADMSSTTSISVTAGATSATGTVTISSGTGAGKLYICNSAAIKDTSNNSLAASTVKSANMYLDNTKPTLSVSVSSGTTYAKSRSATITIADGVSLDAGTYTIKYAWGTSDVACEDMTSTTSITVTAGDTSKTASVIVSSGTGAGKIYICNSAAIKDSVNNSLAASTVKSANMYLDNTAPTLTVTVSSGTTYAKSRSATITIADGVSLAAGTYTIKYAWGTSAVACADMTSTTSITVAAGDTSKTASVTISSGTGAGKIYICNSAAIKDSANNSIAASTVKNANMYLDNSAPSRSISTTSNLKTTSQTATLTCGDNQSKVVSYYWGTTAPDSSSTYTSVTATTSLSVTKTVSSAGTYYLACKDSLGNTSSAVSKKYNTYKINNMLNKLSSTKNTYSTDNYAQTSTATYLAPNGTTITWSSVYTIPTGSKSGSFRGYSTGAASTTPATLSSSNVTLSANSTYTVWFWRNAVRLYYKVESGETLHTGTAGSSNTWTTDSNGYVLKDGSKAYSIVEYGGTTMNLYDNKSSGYFYITKTNMVPRYNAEWKCTSGCKTVGSTYTQAETTVTLTNICQNIATQDCSVDLVANLGSKTIQVTFHNVGGTGGTTASQSFTYGASGNKFGKKADGSCYFSTCSGQFGKWDKSGYTLLGWSKTSGATTAQYSVYSNVSDNWISQNSPSVDLYTVWEVTTTFTCRRSPDGCNCAACFDYSGGCWQKFANQSNGTCASGWTPYGGAYCIKYYSAYQYCTQGTQSGNYCYLYNQTSCPSGWTKVT